MTTTMISQSLTDALKQVLQSLQLPFIFPAAVFVLSTSLLLPIEIGGDSTTRTMVAATATVVLSYLLYACNVPIIRLVEGYSLDQTLFFRFTHWLENRRYQRLKEQIEECDRKIKELSLFQDQLFLLKWLTPEWEQKIHIAIAKWIDHKRPLQEQMELRFPISSRKALPTALGNTIAAFEGYPWSRYRIDAVHLWPRLIPILERKKFTSLVLSEKAIFDFLLNMGLMLVGICFELLILSGLHADTSYLWITLLLLIIAYVLYQGAVVAAQHWGGMDRVAFDLYRDDLRRALYLPDLPDQELETERRLWQTVSNFIVFGDDEQFRGFVYSRPHDDQGQTKKED